MRVCWRPRSRERECEEKASKQRVASGMRRLGEFEDLICADFLAGYPDALLDLIHFWISYLRRIFILLETRIFLQKSF